MLALSRYEHEALVFKTPSNDVIVVNIIEVKGERVKIAIDAKREIEIYRAKRADGEVIFKNALEDESVLMK